MRIRPTDAADYRWPDFENWADDNDVGESEDDYKPWWDCWKTAIRVECDYLEDQLTTLEESIQRIKHSL